MSLLMRQPVVKGLMGDNTLDNLSKEYSLYRLPNENEEVKTEIKQLPELK